MIDVRDKAQRVLEDVAGYFWVGVCVALGAFTVARILIQAPKPPVRARL